jgi:hypothetical protein
MEEMRARAENEAQFALGICEAMGAATDLMDKATDDSKSTNNAALSPSHPCKRAICTPLTDTKRSPFRMFSSALRWSDPGSSVAERTAVTVSPRSLSRPANFV